ncbi:unnamed protein product, partial [Ectocarpus sp. 13 AM-2016]
LSCLCTVYSVCSMFDAHRRQQSTCFSFVPSYTSLRRSHHTRDITVKPPSSLLLPERLHYIATARPQASPCVAHSGTESYEIETPWHSITDSCSCTAVRTCSFVDASLLAQTL